MLTPDQKGAIAETTIVARAARLGVPVYRPVSEGGRYDFIFELGSELVRVQCKWAVKRGNAVVVPFYSCRRTREGLKRLCYTPDEVDAFAAYCPELDSCYYLPFRHFTSRTGVHLRVAPTRNGQANGVRWAADYDFDATLAAQRGAIAQLGERDTGSVEVAGSSPAGSTSGPRQAALFVPSPCADPGRPP